MISGLIGKDNKYTGKTCGHGGFIATDLVMKVKSVGQSRRLRCIIAVMHPRALACLQRKT